MTGMVKLQWSWPPHEPAQTDRLHRARGTLRSRRKKRPETEPIAIGDLADLGPPAWMTASQQDGWRYAIQHAPRGVIDVGVRATWVLAEDQQRSAALQQKMLDRVDARRGRLRRRYDPPQW